jgi:protein-L-isoaspartate O-methyltransferase
VTPALSGLISAPLSPRKADWMRRLGTGTGFAVAKLSEVVDRSERSLAAVRMTVGRALLASVRTTYL